MKYALVFLLLAACSASDPLTIGEDSQGIPGPRGEQGPPGAEGPPGLPGAPAPNPDGSRLKALYQRGVDGASVQLASFFDSERGEKCSSAVDANGTPRCMPFSGCAVAGIYFSEATCTKAIGYAASNCGVPKYAITSASSCMVTTVRLFDIGPQYMGPTWVKSGGSCVSLAGGGTFYDLGAEVDPTSFVEMKEEQ